jgi:hypothetical protein
MARQSPIIRKDAIVPHHAIMGDMSVRQEMVATPNHRFLSRTRPTVHRNKFPKVIFIPYLQQRWLCRILQILRPSPDRTKRMEDIPGAKDTWPLQIHMAT